MMFSRRKLLKMLTVLAAGTAGGNAVRAAPAGLNFGAVLGEAEELSKRAYAEPGTADRYGFNDLTYDQYRDIRFHRDRGLWAGQGLNFQVDFFHPGFRFRTPVEILAVEGGQAQPVAFTPEMFEYGPLVTAPTDPAGLGFSGFRVRAPINTADVMDEFAVFQGASYFRSVAKGQRYGLSARGLAINTADPEGEEFPHFRKFWLMRPEPGATSLVVLALLDSPSTTGAYRFAIRPGSPTAVDIELVLFPRVEMPRVGFGALSSMFLFGPSGRAGYDDFRNAVHDSEGLQIVTGAGERVYRPLANPSRLQVSAFLDRGPRGFGLVQRTRSFSDYQDLETRFELRPSAWIEPIGDWGAGAVVLVEIPAETETNDNIVAYWRPSDPIPAGRPYALTYRLTWCETPPVDPAPARVVASRGGLSFDRKRRLFVVDFDGLARDDPAPTVDVSATRGTVGNVSARWNPPSGGYRVSFELDTGRETLIELRLVLVRDAMPVSETWLYRWTPA
ncbi:glucan biosynthesis protein G [Thalassobaculum sp.]